MKDLELFSTPPKAVEGPKGTVRSFEGDGTPFLKVPGLIKVRSVRIGTTEIPLTITEHYPIDLTENLTNLEEHDVPLIKQDKLDDGTPILIRSIKSNDGFWQKGVEVHVDGSWSKEADAPSGTGATSPSGAVGKADETQKGTNGQGTSGANAGDGPNPAGGGASS